MYCRLMKTMLQKFHLAELAAVAAGAGWRAGLEHTTLYLRCE